MLRMRPTPPHTPAAEVCLLLRSHAEARWLGHELVPVLRDLERASLERDASGAREELGAAPAYLEGLWLDARLPARKPEAAPPELDTRPPPPPPPLAGRDRRPPRAAPRRP